MTWIVIAFIGPLLYALSNIVDNHLIRKSFRSPWALAFYTSIFCLAAVPAAMLMERPPPLNLLPALLAIAGIEILYLVPYYRALSSGDTSSVTALFSLGKVLVPIAAYFVLGETLGTRQYAGFALVVMASAALTFKSEPGRLFGRPLRHMAAVSALLAAEAVLYKVVIEQSGWASGFFLPMVLQAFMALLLLSIPAARKQIVEEATTFRGSFAPLMLSTGLTFAGTAAAAFAISRQPVTYQSAIGSVQPFLVLAIGWVTIRAGRNEWVTEDMAGPSIGQKVVCFSFMVLGLGLVLR